MKRNDVENDMQDVRAHRSSNTLAKVPVVVLMAMSPAMINAGQPRTNIETEAPAKTEMVAAPSKLDTEALDELTATYPRVEVLQQSGKYDYLKKKWNGVLGYTNIRRADIYNANGEKNYMVYVGNYKNDVKLVYLIPKSFNKISAIYLPVVSELVYHNLGSSDKNFCSVKVETNLGRDENDITHLLTRDVRIPDNVANNLVELLTGRMGYEKPHINFSETTTAKLQAPVVRIRYKKEL